MGNTWITDMSHFDYPEEEAYTLPKQALKLWAFFGSIVDGTVGRPPFRRTAGIRLPQTSQKSPLQRCDRVRAASKRKRDTLVVSDLWGQRAYLQLEGYPLGSSAKVPVNA